MTLIVVLSNEDQVIQLSDRRLSNDKNIVNEESNKVGFFEFENARFVYGYTGIAEYNKFKAKDWIISALTKSACQGYDSERIFKQIQEEATRYFKTSPDLRSLHPRDKRFSVMLTGYLYPYGGYELPLAVSVIFSNYQNFKTGLNADEATEEFQPIYFQEKRPNNGKFTFVQSIGRLLTGHQVNALRLLLDSNTPPEALIGKGIEIIREVSDLTVKPIGKQITALTLPRDLRKGSSESYHSHIPYHSSFMADIVSVYPGRCMAIKDMELSPVTKDSSTLLIPKVGRNARCPCNSGKKYKRCHGK